MATTKVQASRDDADKAKNSRQTEAQAKDGTPPEDGTGPTIGYENFKGNRPQDGGKTTEPDEKSADKADKVAPDAINKEKSSENPPVPATIAPLLAQDDGRGGIDQGALVPEADPREVGSIRVPVVAPRTETERREKARTDAEKQADKDALVRAKPPKFDTKPGQQPSLHELNLRAQETRRALVDEARAAANAAGKAAYDVLRGSKSGASGQRDVASRFRNMGNMQASAQELARKQAAGADQAASK